MLIHGDMDYVPMQQAELMWQRILGWFDEHLKGKEPDLP